MGASSELSCFLPVPSFCADVPRGEVAADREHPHGSRNHVSHGMSVLEQHCAFFDRNKDGIIYPWETYEGGALTLAIGTPIW